MTTKHKPVSTYWGDHFYKKGWKDAARGDVYDPPMYVDLSEREDYIRGYNDERNSRHDRP